MAAEPAILKRLIQQLRENGKSKSAAYAIAVRALQKSGNLKPGSTQATAQGKKRGAMTPAERAIDRANRKRKGKYRYNPHNNTAVKGEINKDVEKRS